jgi:hypothetical protein
MFDFETFFADLVAHLRAAFPTVPAVEEYPRLRTKIAAPAILVELADLTPREDPGTEQLSLSARFEARIIFDQAPMQTGAKPDLQCLSLAAAVALSVFRAPRFGSSAGPAREIRIEPDHFKPELAGYVVWLVEWTHDIELGASVWDGAGVTPTEIWAGTTPLVGTGNEEHYTEVTDA